MNLELSLQPQRYAVVRLSASDAIPQWATAAPFFSITRTAYELSVICEEERVPQDCTASRGWRAFALSGPFAFDETGIAAECTAILARETISVLVVSTYDTDWLFVPADGVARATLAFRAAGHRVLA